MIVFDLRCSSGHVFEAWFASTAAYDEQRASGLVECALCGATEVDKAVMAPNIAAKGNRAADLPPAMAKDLIAKLSAAQADLLKNSSWVGADFACRARAMHLGEETPAAIHGQASATEARALIDEGVPIAPLPLPVVPPEARN